MTPARLVLPFAPLLSIAFAATACGNGSDSLADARRTAVDGSTLRDASLLDATAPRFDAPPVHVDATTSHVDAAQSIDSARAVDAIIVTIDAAVVADAKPAADATVDAVPPSPPAVTSLSPNVVNAHAFTLINVNGTGFTGATAVFVGATAVDFSFISDGALTFTTPSEPDSNQDVTVVTPVGTSPISGGDVIQFVN